MKKFVKLFSVIGLILAVAVYYYITLPAVNIHSAGFWWFIISILAVLFLICMFRCNRITPGVQSSAKFIVSLPMKISGLMLLAAILIYGIGSLLGSPIINAGKYQRLLEVETRDFAEDIEPADYSRIPLLDKDSASLLGDRKMGSMVEFVSQFEVGDDYTQINYQGKPVRVTPLEYASTIKWLTNMKDGIPAYIMIDMTTQETECVMLEEGIRYSKSELFNRNIYRHLRFHYPTYIFGDQIFFEIDEEGTPYWVCPVKKFNIGLFGGETVGRVVLVNAITGECTDYDVDEVPSWIDKVYSAELLMQLYDYSGVYINGFLNSVLGQRGCLQSTNGYNYIAMDDDVWVYTGVTSLGADQSNVGFVLMNQRTMETHYYVVEGAIEDSAMMSAEGQVQNLGYISTFPLLLNIEDEPTYFMALKDDAGLVKKYAMVNVQKYQFVAIGDTIKQTEENYRELLVTNGIIEDTGETNAEPEAIEENQEPDSGIAGAGNTGTEPGSGQENSAAGETTAEAVTIIAYVSETYELIVDGDSYLYIFLEDSNDILAVNLTVGDNVRTRNITAGMQIAATYIQSDNQVKQVTELLINQE